MSEPAQKPGRSKQDYQTPMEFIRAVEGRFGPLAWDLAATAENARSFHFVGPDDDTLGTAWHELAPGEWLWLNPPFGDIESFARKAALESSMGARILMLVPASVGTEWFRQHALGKAMVLALNPRMSFDGKCPYPKDLMLLVYSHGIHGFDQWRWKQPRQENNT